MCHTGWVKRSVKAAVSAIAIALGGYAFADAWDIVPGPLTNKPLLEESQPYPEAMSVSLTAPDILTASEGAAPDPGAVRQEILAFVEDSRVTGEVSFLVADSITGEVLAERNLHRPSVPASNMKIVTSVAALNVLGPDRTFDTVVTLSGTELFLVGGGDVLMAADAGNPHATLGRAGLGDLARDTAAELTAQGVTSVVVNVDSTLFEAPLYHPDTVGGANQNYVMEMRPIAIERSRTDYALYTPNPDLSAAQVFAEHLRAAGIEVTEVERGASPDGATEVARVASAPVREIIEFVMVFSDNTTAEVLAHMVAAEMGKPVSFAGGGEAVRQSLSDMGYDVAGVVISDSSGLSDNNRISVYLLYDILQDVWECEVCELAAFPASMPVAGLEGTLTDRFQTTDLEGDVKAKTGTLVKANALSGYMFTDSGRPLTFAIIVDNIEVGTSPGIRIAMDEALERISNL